MHKNEDCRITDGNRGYVTGISAFKNPYSGLVTGNLAKENFIFGPYRGLDKVDMTL